MEITETATSKGHSVHCREVMLWWEWICLTCGADGNAYDSQEQAKAAMDEWPRKHSEARWQNRKIGM